MLGGKTVERKIVIFSEQIEHQGIKKSILPSLNVKVIKYLPLVNAAAVEWEPSFTREEVLESAGVLKVIDDVKLNAVEVSAAAGPSQVLPWGVNRIDAEKVWGQNTGRQVKVGVIDTGIDTKHPDLKVYGGINTINPKKGYQDNNGHGTHVAGVIAALNNSVGVIGVAFDAMLYSVKVLDANGSGYLSDVIEGLEWCANNGIQVINMSLGMSSDVDLLRQAIKRVYDAGVFIAAAAGNSGPNNNTVIYPARYPEVAAVAASDPGDNIASFSSRGPEVDLTAPGVDIYSTYRKGSYSKLSGTSMATPHVAGAAALVLAQKGRMKPAELLNHLKETARDIHHWPEAQGAGLVDAYDAVVE